MSKPLSFDTLSKSTVYSAFGETLRNFLAMTKTKVLYIENDDDQRVELKDLLQQRKKLVSPPRTRSLPSRKRRNWRRMESRLMSFMATMSSLMSPTRMDLLRAFARC